MNLVSIDFEGRQVRMVGTPDKPEWIAADVGKVLGIRSVGSTMREFRDAEKGVHSMQTLGGPQKVATVTEPGLYRLIFKSRKPEAERFQSFVFDKVLPSIRQHGCYPPPEVTTDSTALVAIDPHALVVQLGETFRQAVFDTTEPRFNALDASVEELNHRVANIEHRRALTKKTKRQHCAVVKRYYVGMCPCCREERILNEGGTRLDVLQFDHWTRPSVNSVKHTWPVCQTCNLSLRDHDWKKTRQPYFDAYQQDRRRFFEFLDGPSLFSQQHYETLTDE